MINNLLLVAERDSILRRRSVRVAVPYQPWRDVYLQLQGWQSWDLLLPWTLWNATCWRPLRITHRVLASWQEGAVLVWWWAQHHHQWLVAQVHLRTGARSVQHPIRVCRRAAGMHCVITICITPNYKSINLQKLNEWQIAGRSNAQVFSYSFWRLRNCSYIWVFESFVRVMMDCWRCQSLIRAI